MRKLSLRDWPFLLVLVVLVAFVLYAALVIHESPLTRAAVMASPGVFVGGLIWLWINGRRKGGK